MHVVEQRTVGPTLGADAIDASWKSAVLGVTITGLFIIVIYRLVGVMATIALAGYAVLSYAALVALGATLTLPGLAGFVLAIGMAVDANVLVFERAREEYAAPPPTGPRGKAGLAQNLRSSLIIGFSRAWSAILDSNVTTILAAGLLFFLASGPVRGFGVTLTIGVLASLVSAMLFTRVLAEFVVARQGIQRRPMLSGLGSTGRVRQWLERRNPDLMGRRRLWLAVSGLLVLVALVGRRRARAEPRCRVHRWPAGRGLDDAAGVASTTPGRQSPMPASHAPWSRRPGTDDITVRTPAWTTRTS